MVPRSFALPMHAADGAKALWSTADAIWDALDDPSDDFNWYSKRAILSGVMSSTLLYWLGDHSEGQAASWEFLDRRIENVMQFEKLKASVNDNRFLRPFLAGPNWLMSQIRRPSARPVSICRGPGRCRGIDARGSPLLNAPAGPIVGAAAADVWPVAVLDWAVWPVARFWSLRREYFGNNDGTALRVRFSVCRT